MGRRIKKHVQDLVSSTSFSRKYVYDSSEIIAELDETNSVLARYTHSGLRTDDVLTTEITSDGVSRGLASVAGSYIYLKDGLGSVQAITTDAGNLVQRYVYSSFGKLLKIVDAAGLETNEIKTAYTYTNRELDEETGLYYYRARYYDAHSGRFMQEDPHPGKSNSPITFNSKYVYAKNQAINYIDPSGNFFIEAIIIGAVISAIMTSASTKGNFFENLFSWEVGGKAFLAGAVNTTLVVGLSMVGGAYFGVLGAMAGGALGGGLGAISNAMIMGKEITSANIISGAAFGMVAGLFVGIGQAGGEIMKSNSIQKALGLDGLSRDTIQNAAEADWFSKLKPKG